MSKRIAAVQLKISLSLLYKILKNRENLLRQAKENENTYCKRNRCGKHQKVEKALKLWFTNVREHDFPITSPLIRQKAEDLAAKMGQTEFVATDGWFHRWRKLENAVLKQTHGEQKSAYVAAAEKRGILCRKSYVQCRRKWTVLLSHVNPYFSSKG
ncbi:hypothetical protein AVEN_128030-1 [Araneus ventricosus]|uniref:HTH CENPB-type domain-containing protein n=1 Tax=Araneus ventricosus TaxID=182803 RepID=A0A4Y2A0B3_ARAVE|nr:hypothetical protein AVEN_128030-1 [Araneus ventricosus]